MLDESLNQFKRSSNISLAFFHVGWCWMRFRAHPTCWNNILERKMSISIKFERLNVRMPIWIYCLSGQLFLSFYKMNSKSGETVEQTKKTVKKGKKKWQMMKSKIWLNCLKWNPVCGIFFRTSTQRGRWKKELIQYWWNIFIPLQLL